MPANISNSPPTAACLTPPGAGGIAVVEVIGREAPAVVNPLLTARRPIDVSTMDPGELRLCRIVDRVEEVLDDAVLAARRLPDGAVLIHISVHGGPRIVQRLLLALKAAGAVVVDAQAHAPLSRLVTNLLEAEAFELLATAKTRAVAAWLARVPAALAAEAERIDHLLAAGSVEAGRAALSELADRFNEALYLTHGIRIVLTGEPNSGKSTLANALAGAEHSVVSEAAGTTRDWVELPAALDGLPITLVDTAGIRHPLDALEQESIRRAHSQIATADVLVRVVDRSAPPLLSDAAGLGRHDMTSGAPSLNSQTRAGCPPPQRPTVQEPPPREVWVWNKSDLPMNAAWTEAQGPAGVHVSALTGEGLAELRRYLLGAAGMAGWANRPARPFTQRQHWLCLAGIAALDAGEVEAGLAYKLLKLEAGPGGRNPAGVV
jgi:tRNA U34 5-carboxymethylaminomethyl modifying GTPase MnmE/TrmE